VTHRQNDSAQNLLSHEENSVQKWNWKCSYTQMEFSICSVYGFVCIKMKFCFLPDTS